MYVYYQLDNFYQNHRRYVKSRDDTQLAGTYKTTEDLVDCDPIIKVGDLWANQKKNLADPPQPLGDDLPAIPCGLVAKSYFNDTYRLLKKDSDDPTNRDKATQITIAEDKIAW